jgi:glucokinase
MPAGSAAPTIGIDLGGTKCLGVLVDSAGKVTATRRVPTPARASEVIDGISELVFALAEDAGRVPRELRIGVGVPGLVDRAGVLRFAPHLGGGIELAVAGSVAAETGAAVIADNDATCAAWAESTVGVAAGRRHIILATLGTGIGGGLVADGRLLRGANGFAGEIGHMVIDSAGPPCPCGQRGCWERYASGSGLGWLARDAARAGKIPTVVALAGGAVADIRGEHVMLAARNGDAGAAGVVDLFSWWLARGLASLVAVLDPEMIVIGGGIVEEGDVLLTPVRQAFAALVEGSSHRPEIPIVAAALGERAGAVGAALLARGEG